MQCEEILTGKNKEELVRHGDYQFPCAIYFTDMDKYAAGEIAWHWHKELELVVIKGGSLYVETSKGNITLNANEGIFINSEELHFMKHIGEEKCFLISYVFDKSFISGERGSIIDRKYMQPLTSCKNLSMVKLVGKSIQQMASVYLKYDTEELGYEIFIRNVLSDVLLEIIEKNQGLMEKGKDQNNLDVERMKNMLAFIGKNYGEEVTLKKIAASAFIGEREALRCFSRTINMSPIEYLQKQRIMAAASLLITTELSVTEICMQVGFGSPSYFSKTFNKILGVTPRAYRKKFISTDK